MRSRHRVMLTAVAFVLATTTVAAAAQDTGFGAGTPESRSFRIDSAVVAGSRGPQVEGYVHNLYDMHATRVRLSVESLDSAGRPLDTRVVYVPLDVPPHWRSFFSAPLPAGAASVRVTVLNFEWLPRGGGGAM